MSAATGIIGTGSCLPTTVVSSDEVDRALGVRSGWTVRATEIRERRRALADTSLTDLAVRAGQLALDTAGVGPHEVRAIIVATVTADPPVPAVATRVQARLGASNAFAFDMNAACAGFLFALEVARPLVDEGSDWPYVLIIGCDIFSRMTDPLDRRTWPLFGDGAGAAVIGPVAQGGMVATALSTAGELGDLAVGGYSAPPHGEVPGPTDHHFRMRGQEITDLMLEEMPTLVNTVMLPVGLTVDDVDYLICHQANPKLVTRCAHRAGFATDQIVNTGTVYGNTASASVPIGLDVAAKDGRLRQGSVALLVAFGAGMSWGCTLIRWSGAGRQVAAQ